MGTKVVLHHRTHYAYEKPVALGPQVIQLRPALHCRTPIANYALHVVPAQSRVDWQLDPFNNRLARLLFAQKTNQFSVDVEFVADLEPVNPFDFVIEPYAADYPFNYPAETLRDLQPYLTVDTPGPLLDAFLVAIRTARCGTVDLLLKLNRKVRDDVAYVTRTEHGVQTCEQTLEKRSGSCRDSAWLLVESLRHFGIAARFVSGYLIQLAGQEDGPKDDSAELHAWAEAFIPGAGWIGLDPTSGMLATEGHIPLVCTPSALQAAPISGTVEPARAEFSYSLTVQRLDQVRTAAHPLSDEEWERVRAVAGAVDAQLAAQDVRLTMGGEPTYVGIDDTENAEWNLEAMGPSKRARGLALIEALSRRMAQGALLHYGQGKWYPGEPLPRWALSCYWRTDGVPVWDDAALIAREDSNSGYGLEQAFIFVQALARRLQVTPDNALAAYDAEAAEPAGYILPIRRRQPHGQLRWSSQLWFPRPDRLHLSFGDSPIGYRIPTDAMPWVAPDDLQYEHDHAPFQDRVKLPLRAEHRSDLFSLQPEPDPLPAIAREPETAPELIRPSLCVQARQGRVHVFLPYVAVLADYLDLITAVEDTSSHLQVPVWIEGYAPPSDPRLRSFSVTPDPGVLEVNLPPAKDWDELESINAVLDEEARKNRLTAQKFAYDGTQLATGGGCHIVIGGASVEDSPILRRPDLLRSMVAFWQNHPSLSYFFSGMYVGPTSQYPRVDEARMDALYELEVAFRNLPERDCPAYVVDGLFRNLLADMTGNTHRAEFCVDKLFPPQGMGLQLGLLELRAFEMPPHVRMSLLQMLLVRALVCSFWKSPFEGSLKPWGPALHDRFMLPEAVKRDFVDVLQHLRAAGLGFEDDWFAAQFEFRFPKIGSIAVGHVELELRHALEPWNVLPEETVSGRTVRSVDSSLERIQVKLSGASSELQYAVSCNGRAVPLQRTPQGDAAVAAVRFRARRLSATLHPTVPVHAPLVFHLIDRARNTAIAQCTYHVAPPNGAVYPARPMDEAEAYRRRQERFQSSQVALAMKAPPAENNPTFPATLDLRMVPSHSLQHGQEQQS